ncbi:hypothetical protein J6590_034418 [Homalodisca vitripennis]|nr:hypothetical protein J6590_034418 [Homalodisca vitripennis]
MILVVEEVNPSIVPEVTELTQFDKRGRSLGGFPGYCSPTLAADFLPPRVPQVLLILVLGTSHILDQQTARCLSPLSRCSRHICGVLHSPFTKLCKPFKYNYSSLGLDTSWISRQCGAEVHVLEATAQARPNDHETLVGFLSQGWLQCYLTVPSMLIQRQRGRSLWTSHDTARACRGANIESRGSCSGRLWTMVPFSSGKQRDNSCVRLRSTV